MQTFWRRSLLLLSAVVPMACKLSMPAIDNSQLTGSASPQAIQAPATEPAHFSQLVFRTASAAHRQLLTGKGGHGGPHLEDREESEADHDLGYGNDDRDKASKDGQSDSPASPTPFPSNPAASGTPAPSSNVMAAPSPTVSAGEAPALPTETASPTASAAKPTPTPWPTAGPLPVPTPSPSPSEQLPFGSSTVHPLTQNGADGFLTVATTAGYSGTALGTLRQFVRPLTAEWDPQATLTDLFGLCDSTGRNVKTAPINQDYWFNGWYFALSSTRRQETLHVFVAARRTFVLKEKGVKPSMSLDALVQDSDRVIAIVSAGIRSHEGFAAQQAATGTVPMPYPTTSFAPLPPQTVLYDVPASARWELEVMKWDEPSWHMSMWSDPVDTLAWATVVDASGQLVHLSRPTWLRDDPTGVPQPTPSASP